MTLMIICSRIYTYLLLLVVISIFIYLVSRQFWTRELGTSNHTQFENSIVPEETFEEWTTNFDSWCNF